VAACINVMKRFYPEQPVVGVAGIIFRDQGVVLIRRGQEPARGEWSLPGGAVEVGENLEEALRREVREETGLEIEIIGLTAVVNRLVRDQAGVVAYHYVLLDFLCRAKAGTPRAGSDSSDLALVSLLELSDWPLPEQTRLVIQQAFQQLIHGSCLPPLLLTD